MCSLTTIRHRNPEATVCNQYRSIIGRIECDRPGFGDSEWNTLHITIEPKGGTYWAVESLTEVFADVKPRVLHSKMRELEVSLALGVERIEVNDANNQTILSISLEGR